MPTLLPASQCTHKVSPMFTIVIHAHVTCTCFHAHERPGIRRSREIGTEIERGGQYACTCTGVLVRLEAHHSNGADSMRMHAFISFCTVSVQFLSYLSP